MTNLGTITAALIAILAVTDARASDPRDVALRLAGTFVAPTSRQALVQFDLASDYLAVEVGDKLGDWTVDAIEAGAVWLAGAGGRVELTVSGMRPPGSAPLAEVRKVIQSWSHPCGRTHGPRHARPLPDTGACVTAWVAAAAS